MTDERTCIFCGCTDLNACVTDGVPCGWFLTFPKAEPVKVGICTGCSGLPHVGDVFLHPDSLEAVEEMRRLQRELADDVARADVESFGKGHRGNGKTDIEQWKGGWYSRPAGSAKADRDAEWFDRAVRYLGLRGLLERHPHNPNLIRLKKEATQ